MCIFSYFGVEYSDDLCFLAFTPVFLGHFRLFLNGIFLNCGPTLWGRMADNFFSRDRGGGDGDGGGSREGEKTAATATRSRRGCERLAGSPRQ